MSKRAAALTNPQEKTECGAASNTVENAVQQSSSCRCHWVFLITNFEPAVKTNSYVGSGEDPQQQLQERQIGDLPTARFDSAAWRLEMIIGPFSKIEAVQTRDTWTTSSRGIESRRQTGIKLYSQAWRKDNTIKLYDVEAK